MYEDRIAKNQEKIKKLDEQILRSTEKRKKLADETTRLVCLSLCSEYRCESQDLLDIIRSEHQQNENPDDASEEEKKPPVHAISKSQLDNASNSDQGEQLSFT